jgi:comEA protein
MFKKPLLLLIIILPLLFLLTCSGIFLSHTFASNVKMTSGALPASNLPIHADSKKMNINTATVDELAQLPGIGTALAERIVTYRSEHGPYKSIEALTNVKGIGTKTLDSFREYITIGD